MRFMRLAKDLPEALTRTATGACVLFASAGAVSGAADTNENTLATITLPANVLGPNGQVKVETKWTLTSSANNKTVKVKLGATVMGGASGTVHTTVASAINTSSAQNRGATNSQLTDVQSITPAALTSALSTAAIDTTADVSITITAQKASAGETMTLESVVVYVIPN